jgi:hypothetical protein
MNADPVRPPGTTTRRFRWASPTTASLLGVLLVASQAADIVMLILAGERTIAGITEVTAVTLVFGAVGVVVARREPRNPVGWIQIGVGLSFILCTFGASHYLQLDYRLHHGALPLGTVAIMLGQAWPAPLLFGPLAILLFPDGRLPSPRWRWVLWIYLASATAFLAGLLTTGASAIIGHRIRIDSSGLLTSSAPRVFSSVVFSAGAALCLLFITACWLAFVGRQVVSWRRSTGERRQQVKWVMCGAAITALSIPLFVNGSNSPIARVVFSVGVLGLAALPVSIGVGILKYRLYEIDRLISRTLSYAILTGLLVGVYLGGVTLTTRALPFSSPIGIAASTLAGAAAFNPLRRRVQHLVDRRFNRARYDAEATIATLTTRLRDAIDLATVQSDLLGVVHHAFEPAHASIWINQENAPSSAARHHARPVANDGLAPPRS